MTYISCEWITHGINFEADKISVCCINCNEGGGEIPIQLHYNGGTIDWDEILLQKRKLINENKAGKINPRCNGCFNLKNQYWNEEEYFDYLHFTHWTKCNCNCIYCYSHEDKKLYNSLSDYKVIPIIKDMIDRNLLRKGRITFAGGEPTMLKELDELLNLLMDFGCTEIVLHTNGIKYSKAIERGIEEGVINLVISFDSGTPTTFKKIKNINGFKCVLRNTKKYAKVEPKDKKPIVSTKYIIIPNYNDNVEELEKWIQVSVDCGVKSLAVDIEHKWFDIQRQKRALPDKARFMLQYVSKRAKELGLLLLYYNSAQVFIENELDYLNYDFIPVSYEPEKQNTVEEYADYMGSSMI